MAVDSPCSILALPLEILQEITTIVYAQDETFANELRLLKDKEEMGRGKDATARLVSMDLLKTTSKWYGRSLWAWSMTCKRFRDLTEKLRFQTITLESSDCEYYLSDIHPRFSQLVATLVLNKVFGNKVLDTAWPADEKDYEECLKTLLPLSSNFHHLNSRHVVNDVAADVFVKLHPPPADQEQLLGQRESSEIKIMRAAYQKLYAQVTELSLKDINSRDIPFFIDNFRRVTSLEIGPYRDEFNNFVEYLPALAKASGIKKLALSRRVGFTDTTMRIEDDYIGLNWQSLRTLTEFNFATGFLGAEEWTLIIQIGSQVTTMALDVDLMDDDLDSFDHSSPSPPAPFANLTTLSVRAPSSLIAWLWKPFVNSPLASVSLAIRYKDLRIKNGTLTSSFLLELRHFATTLRHLKIESSDFSLEDFDLGVIRDYVGTINSDIRFESRNFDTSLWEPISDTDRGTDGTARPRVWERSGIRKKERVEAVLDYVRDQLEGAERMQDSRAVEELALLMGTLWARKEVGSY